MKTVKIFIFLFVLAFITSCKKESPPPVVIPTPYYISMTDAPAAYKHVYVDLKAVEITGNGGSAITLNANPGIYDLLKLNNGVDTLIATGALYIKKVQQIRLILGTNNSVVTSDNISHPLSTPSAQQSGLKLQVHQELQAGVAYHVLLDFDANQSIVEEGNGKYSLKPVIRTIETAVTGAIRGKISQPGIITSVTASSNNQAFSSQANANGEFIVPGLPPGLYKVVVSPLLPYNTATISNVGVSVGVTTDIGIVMVN